MAIGDFFKNMFKKQKRLPEAQERKVEAEQDELNVFAEQSGKETKRIIKINVNGVYIPIGEVLKTEKRPHLKEIASSISRILETAQKRTGNESDFVLMQRKNIAKNALYDLSETYGFRLFPDIDYILDCYLPSKTIDYTRMYSSIPKTIDMDKMNDVQVMDMGSVLDDRLKTLSKIKTPEDASLNKEDIISFMKSQETDDPVSMVISTNLDSINGQTEEHLDLSTLVACTKALRRFENEDTLIYSAYLKLEEKRILKTLVKQIEETRTEENSEQINTLIEDLESMMIESDSNPEEQGLGVMKYMISVRDNKNIQRYVSQHARKDMEIKKYVLESGIPNGIEFSEFFASRIASLGQVTNLGKYRDECKVVSLRKIIEESELKDADDRESNEFLLMASRLEKDYIINNYSTLLARYYSLVKTKIEERNGLSNNPNREDEER